MVTTITANEQRRQQISYVFITLIGLGSAGVGAFSDQFNPLYVSVPGIFLSFIWWSQIRFLKRLATAKWQVIGKMESTFSIKPFAEEWASFNKGTPRANLSDIEMFVPALCFFVCLGYTLWRILA